MVVAGPLGLRFPPMTPDPNAGLDEIRLSFRAWLREHQGSLEPFRSDDPGNLADSYARFRPLMRMLFDAGWTRLGWPESCGGLGGSPVQRAEVMEELAAAGYIIPELYATTEIIAPMLIKYAPELAARHVAKAIAGDEVWCQGFSEPDAGSDLGSLRTRAVAEGDTFRVSGQKMWSSNGGIANWSCVLVRTGDAESRHRGLTMLWIDLSSPGVTVRPTACENGREEVAEVFLDDVIVPQNQLIGPVGAGWPVVMYLMQYERGAYAWKRQAELHSQLDELLGQASDSELRANASAIGAAYLAVFALRSQASPTLSTLASGRDLGPEISVDKLLLGATEQIITDTARQVLWPALELDDSDIGDSWRRRWSYARITTVYGGAAEVQRDLVGERLLGLPRGR